MVAAPRPACSAWPASRPWPARAPAAPGRPRGRRQQRLAGDEGHHELGRALELPPVLLLGQLVHVGAQLAGVLLEERRASSSSSASMNLRKASSGTFESMTTWPPPGMCTIMSGRRRPSSVVVDRCSSKSQCSSMPAVSTARRSCISPQRPRVCGERRAVTRLRVSFCSCSWPRWSCATFSLNPS